MWTTPSCDLKVRSSLKVGSEWLPSRKDETNPVDGTTNLVVWILSIFIVLCEKCWVGAGSHGELSLSCTSERRREMNCARGREKEKAEVWVEWSRDGSDKEAPDGGGVWELEENGDSRTAQSQTRCALQIIRHLLHSCCVPFSFLTSALGLMLPKKVSGVLSFFFCCLTNSSYRSISCWVFFSGEWVFLNSLVYALRLH